MTVRLGVSGLRTTTLQINVWAASGQPVTFRWDALEIRNGWPPRATRHDWRRRLGQRATFADSATLFAFCDSLIHARHMTQTFDDEYWDQIWGGERAASMATSEPNPHLARELSDLVPGTALDAGCGGGAEAIWLASRGWQVIGADIAAAALAHAAERADASGVAGRVAWEQADLSTWEPGVTFDLVTTHYAHLAMPQLEFYDRIAGWVAPGGTLLIVGHLHHDASGHRERAGGEVHGHGHHDPPAAASATAAAITARLDPARWEVVTAAETHRVVPGHDVTLRDVVVRARRQP